MKRTSSAVFCEVCCSSEAKYRCPRCGTRTCSVTCVKAHKTDNDCDGRRCRTGFISQSEFSDNHLLSDYRLLEEMGCYADSISRDGVVKKCQKKYHGLNLHKLKAACRNRNISFLYQDAKMTKRIQNSTIYHRRFGLGGICMRKHFIVLLRRDAILWKVEWIFADVEDAQFTANRVCEDTPLKILLEKYLHPTKADPVIRHRLQKYMSAGGVDNVEVYMKVEWKQLRGTRYYKLDVTQCLRENLSYKTVIEYPTLHVCLKQSSSNGRYVVYDRSLDYVITQLAANTRTSGNGNSNHGDDDILLPERSDMTHPIGHSILQCDNTNPHPPTIHCDTEEEREDHVIQSSNESTNDHVIQLTNGSTNGLELLMGQYGNHDTDSELEPGEIS